MAKHCQDPHCGNFAPQDSDWCKRHRAEQIQTGLLAMEDQTAFGMRHIEERYGDPDQAWVGGVEIQPTGEFRKLGDPTQAGRDASEKFASGFIGTEHVRPIETDKTSPRFSQEAIDALHEIEVLSHANAAAIGLVQSAAEGAKRGRRKHRAPKTQQRSWRRLFRKAGTS